MRGFAVQSEMNPDIGFALYVHDSDYDKAKELAYAGLFAWLGNVDLRKKYFSEFEVDDFYWNSIGYFEPTEYLLDTSNIEYLIESCFDEDGDWLEGFNQVHIEEVI